MSKTYFGHHEKEIREFGEANNARNNTVGSRTRGRPTTTWMDNILQWTGYTLDKTLMYSEDTVK